MNNNRFDIGGLFKSFAFIAYFGIPFVLFIWFWAGGINSVFEIAYPILSTISTFSILAIFVLLFLAIFKKTRGFASAGIVICAYIIVPYMWLMSAAYVYEYWSIWAIVVGTLFFGFGVNIIAFFCLMFNGLWSEIPGFLIMAFFAYGMQFIGIQIYSKNADRLEKEWYEKYSKELEIADLKQRVAELELKNNEFQHQIKETGEDVHFS